MHLQGLWLEETRIFRWLFLDKLQGLDSFLDLTFCTGSHIVMIQLKCLELKLPRNEICK